MPPDAASVSWLSRETGACEATLYNWRNEYRRQGGVVPAASWYALGGRDQ